MPLIVITADRPPELRGRGAGQTIDQMKLFGSAVRWFCELGVARADDEGLLHYRSAAARAVAEALGRPPGPVHLNVPLQEPLAPDRRSRGRHGPGPAGRSRRPARGRRSRRVRSRAVLRATAPLVDTLARRLDGNPRGA